ncbi:unnamed protein product [Closterium sp. NIES-53]
MCHRSIPCTICAAPVTSHNNHLLNPPTPHCSDVSNNSLYGRINRNFRNMVADGDALINLAHNFFFGDAMLFAAGCQICPVEITESDNLLLGDASSGDGAGKCISGISAKKDYPVAEAGKGARVSLAGNCLTLSLDSDCPSNATQRYTAAYQAFCSITDNGPCDGHGECVPPAPASPSNFTCLCRDGYSAVDLSNGSTCAVVNTTTTEVSSLSTGAIVGIAVGCFAGFTLLAIILAWVLWPRKQGKWEGLDVCEQYTLQEMVKATNNWAKENQLGKGGFGDQNMETGKQEQILVYEFVGNRDLQYHIHKSGRPLSLRQRLRLAQGAAEGLAYLHGFDTPIVHRDIKPTNILVTHDMQAKVAEFGMLKRLTHGDSDATRVAGTPGYVDLDYNRTNVITAKRPCRGLAELLRVAINSARPLQGHASGTLALCFWSCWLERHPIVIATRISESGYCHLMLDSRFDPCLVLFK